MSKTKKWSPRVTFNHYHDGPEVAWNGYGNPEGEYLSVDEAEHLAEQRAREATVRAIKVVMDEIVTSGSLTFKHLPWLKEWKQENDDIKKKD